MAPQRAFHNVLHDSENTARKIAVAAALSFGVAATAQNTLAQETGSPSGLDTSSEHPHLTTENATVPDDGKTFYVADESAFLPLALTALQQAGTDAGSKQDSGQTVNIRDANLNEDKGISTMLWIIMGLGVLLFASKFYASRQRTLQQRRHDRRKAKGELSGGTLTGRQGKMPVRHKEVKPSEVKERFSDVAGIDEAKKEVEQIVAFLKDPDKFNRLGARIPKGALLVGPPGTGKTLLARAMAGEAGRPFFHISGSDFNEMYVGVGAARIDRLFEDAKKKAPCVIFIDEIDGVGRSRGGQSNDESDKTLNKLLTAMDGFEKENTGVIVVGATNRVDILDTALLRPGRFDRHINVPLPDVAGRKAILEVHARKVPLADDVDLGEVARQTPGLSGSHLANVINEAALQCAFEGKETVDRAAFSESVDKVILGAARTSMVLDEPTKERIAYHEVGHTLISLLLPDSDPLRKVTIIPRGQGLGLTWTAPEKEKHLLTEDELKARMVMLFGGRVTEEIIYGAGKVTTGASNDIVRATQIAWKMVTEYGMSSGLGRINYIGGANDLQPGVAYEARRSFSEVTGQKIDDEVRNLVDEAEKKAREIIESHRNELELLTSALIERETLSAEDVKQLLARQQKPRPQSGDTPTLQ